jgi:hypothetical protein
MHDFVFTSEDDVNHNFTCSKCGKKLDFNKPGIGTPNADLSGPVPQVPADADEYVTPCEVP